MDYANRSLFSVHALFIISVLLVGASVPAAGQTAADAHRPACTEPAHERIAASSLLESSGKSCATVETEPAAVQPQTAPQNPRLFWVLPNYTTVEERQQFTKLSTGAKFKLARKTVTDPVTVSLAAGFALLGQARNSDPSYGQGFRGYDKRFATFYADTAIGTLLTTSAFPTLLRQDPRYFQLGKGSKLHRTLYSASRTFITPSDRGELQFNYSVILGHAVAAAISNAYRPQSQRTLGHTLSVWGTETMLSMLCNVGMEFWPDIRRKFHRQKQPN